MSVTIPFVNLYVRDPAVSIRFFVDLLGVPALEEHPNFAMLPMAPGVMLGLWKLDDVTPPVSPNGDARSELAITVQDREAVLALHQDWIRRGISVIQAPILCDFGFTFTASDPDGHRIRVMALPPMA